jgi:DNA-binding MarR family transcriptional regulator
LVADLGLTSARWQVLGAVALAPQAPTAPQIGLRMGLTRQAVQKQLGPLLTSGLLVAASNPAHRRSPTYVLTDTGRRLYSTVDGRQRRWAATLSAGGTAAAWDAAAQCLEQLSIRLDAAAAKRG